MKKKVSSVLTTAFILLAGAVCFFQFNTAGYLLTVPFRSTFQKIDDNLYINKGYSGSAEEISDIIGQAVERDTAFFGEMRCLDDTMIIICDNEKLTQKIGDKTTHTLAFPKKKDVICISQDYLNVDIIAHELTHAELHTHLSVSARRRLPTWFDEGTATQNDYREQYSPENWVRRTDNGKNSVLLEDMDTPEEFYSDPVEERQFRYICAKHEISQWLETHTVQDLLGLADRFNDGEDFYTLYNK